MSVWVLALPDLPRREVDRVSGLLWGQGAVGLQEEWMPGEAPAPRQPWDTGPPAPEPDRVLLQAYFEDEVDQAQVEAAVHPRLVRWERVEERDWEAESRASFAPVEVAPGWVIAPPWDAPPGALIVEPGQGFGTGHHPSTRMALRLMLAHSEGCASALDVGCGSGVLALAARRLGMRAHGVDVEEAAIRDARRNAELNGLDASFAVGRADALGPGPWDLVLANLHAELLVEHAAGLVARAGRVLVLAGILADRQGSVRQAFAGLSLAGEEIEGEWVALAYRRR